ncbi:MAG: hypothetical protein JWN74_2238 [Acidobacteriaceae bacterium]|nr:hypothetical protein [Acidobacteriaceae bacterium]
MAVLQQLEFFLLRYAGDATKGESINLGVVAIAPSAGGSGEFADVRFIRNWRRLHCFDPLADVEEVQAIEREIRQDLQDPQRRADLLKRLADSWSNVIRFEQLQVCLTESPALEMERLNTIYLETPAGTEKREISGRQRILSVMRDELQKAGVLALMQTNIAVSEYTRPGDPLKLDFGYAADDGFKFLHAVSLAQRVDQGMILAARFPQIAASMQTKKGVKAWLTAVVDDDVDRGLDEVNFALDMMQENGIIVAPAATMPQIADGIRVAVRP